MLSHNQLVSSTAKKEQQNSIYSDANPFRAANCSTPMNYRHAPLRKFSTIDYEAEQCIGKGTFGRVLRAKATSRTFVTMGGSDQLCCTPQFHHHSAPSTPWQGSHSCEITDAQINMISECGEKSDCSCQKHQDNIRHVANENGSRLIASSEYYVAVKVLRKKIQYIKQGREEIAFLNQINKSVIANSTYNASSSLLARGQPSAVNSDLARSKFNRNIIKMLSSFCNDTGELCIVFELLQCNLFEYIKSKNFQPLHLHEIRVIMTQLCVGLDHLHSNDIIHTDLKPENIMLVDKTAEVPLAVRIIDLGSACSRNSAKHLTYLQSRYYRSPEIIMALPFDTAVDIWSLGCVGVEMFLGSPLYPGNSEYDLLKFINSTQGPLPQYMLISSSKTSHFYDSMCKLKSCSEIYNTLGKRYESKETRKYLMKSLSSLILFESPDDARFDALCQEGDFQSYVLYLNETLYNHDQQFSGKSNMLASQKSAHSPAKTFENVNKAVNAFSSSNANKLTPNCQRSNFATLKVLHDLRPNRALLFPSDKLAHDKQLFWREAMARRSDKIEFVRLICAMMHLDPNERCTAKQALETASDFLTMQHLLVLNNYPNVYAASALDLNNDAQYLCDLGDTLPTTSSVFRNLHNCTISPLLINKFNYINDPSLTGSNTASQSSMMAPPSGKSCAPTPLYSSPSAFSDYITNFNNQELSNSTCDSFSNESLYDEMPSRDRSTSMGRLQKIANKNHVIAALQEPSTPITDVDCKKDPLYNIDMNFNPKYSLFAEDAKSHHSRNHCLPNEDGTKKSGSLNQASQACDNSRNNKAGGPLMREEHPSSNLLQELRRAVSNA